MSAPVLVIGATGKTGRAVARALLARGVPVRAAARAGRADAVLGGTTPVAVDLETGAGLDAALDGIRAVYHLAPNVHPDEVAMAARMADAAAAAGTPRSRPARGIARSPSSVRPNCGNCSTRPGPG